MTDSKALIEQATRRAAILHASAAWGSDEDGALIDRLLAHIEKLEAELDRCRKSNVVMDNTVRELEADNARLREEIMQIEVDAMEHYNDWMEHGCEPVEATRFAFDLGQYTRAALQETSHDD